jgi:DNA processing protein
VQDTDPQPASDLGHCPDALADWIRLEQASGVGCRTARALLEAFGAPGAIFRANHRALAAHASPAQVRALCALPSPELQAQVDATRAWLAQDGHHLLTLHDPGYPALLAAIPDPPLLLYIKGRIELLARPAVAVVGSRNASEQGKANARRFARALSEAGLCVVSGLALGVDTAAHEGALEGPGATVAVIGTGIDRVYPARNRELAHRIAREGCIVSEYPLGMPPVAGNFPRRNRVISGLAAGVLVVEAAAESGSLITAQLAAEQGREVFAIPGSIHSTLAKGCHQLIREGAQLVETVDEVLAAMHGSPLAAASAPPPREAGLSLGADAAAEAGLLGALGYDPVGIDALLERLGGDAGEVGARLLALELAGLVEQLPGGRVQRIGP